MPIALANLGIQTFSFRAFKGRELIARLRACGLSRIELCTIHVDFADAQAQDRLIADFREAGIALDALGVHGCGGPDDERVFAFAQRAGIRVIGVDFAPALSADAFRAAEKLAERYELRLAIHNHGGQHWLGSAAMLERVFAATGERIGLCLDTAWAMHASEDPIALVRRFGRRLYGLHVKDFTFDAAGEHRDVVIGEGNLDLGALAAALDEVGFAGYAALEYEGEPEDPAPAIRACLEAARQELCGGSGASAPETAVEQPRRGDNRTVGSATAGVRHA